MTDEQKQFHEKDLNVMEKATILAYQMRKMMEVLGLDHTDPEIGWPHVSDAFNKCMKASDEALEKYSKEVSTAINRRADEKANANKVMKNIKSTVNNSAEGKTPTKEVSNKSGKPLTTEERKALKKVSEEVER